MADMTFKANLLPVSDLEKNLGASNQRWNIYGNLTGNASTADKWKTARTLIIGSTEKLLDGSANISWSHAEIGAIVSNTWTDGTTAGPAIKTTVNGVSGTAVAIPSASASASGAVTTGTQTFAGDKVFNGKLRIEPSYSSLSDSYNEGIRINQASNGWAEIVVGGTKDSASGIADGVWIVGRRGAAGGKTGAVGDFTIEEENSNGSGLTLYKDLGGAFLYSNKAANTASLTIYNAHALNGYTGWGIDAIAPNMTAGSNNVILVGHSNASKNSAYIGFHYTASGSNDNYLRLGMYAADDLIVAKGNGNVGIGTTAPSYKLHVIGTVYATGSPGFWNQTATGTWSYLRLHNGSNYWDIATKSDSLSGALEFRPGGAASKGPYIQTSGNLVITSGMSWPAPQNITCTATANNQEWSFDMSTGSYTGCYWHVWSSKNGASCLQCFTDDRHSWAYKLYGAVWNDYAEYRETKEEIEPGRCIKETGKGDLVLTTKRLERGCEIVSDTYGFAIGQSKKNNTPTATSGRVLAFLYEDNEYAKDFIGWPVCSGPNGTVSIMTEEEEMRYPSRIIGTISEIPDYEEWECGDEKKPEYKKVNGRVWIRVR